MNTKKIYTLGPEGSFHHLSANEYLGNDKELVFCNSFEAIFEAVKDGQLGWIAIHNSQNGLVGQHEQQIKAKFNFLDEYEYKLSFALAAQRSIALEKIGKLYSHQQALMQFKSLLKSKLPQAELVEKNSTSAAAKFVADSTEEDYAALCNPKTAANYGLEVIQTLEPKSANYTTFALFS
jgi:prephenate dehydratase